LSIRGNEVFLSILDGGMGVKNRNGSLWGTPSLGGPKRGWRKSVEHCTGHAIPSQRKAPMGGPKGIEQEVLQGIEGNSLCKKVMSGWGVVHRKRSRADGALIYQKREVPV